MSTSNITSNNNTQALPRAKVADIEAQTTVSHEKTDVRAIDMPILSIRVQSSVDDSDNVATCCAFSCVGITVLVLLSPFIICDLYFAYNSISCQHDTSPVGITLTTWLEVAGFSLIGFIGSFLLTTSIVVCCGLKSMVWFVPVQWLFSLFSFAWLIVGCVLFWRYLDPSGDCGRDVSDYMWARLIIGLIGVFVSSRSGDKKKD